MSGCLQFWSPSRSKQLNPLCECQDAGYCTRHEMSKVPRQFQLCKGVAKTADCGRKYWIAWERGKIGATAPEHPETEPPSFCEEDRSVDRSNCIHRGEETGREQCRSCSGTVMVKKFGCDLHGECTIGKVIEGIRCCNVCPDATSETVLTTTITPVQENRKLKKSLSWSYGVTTVEDRVHDLLPKTLASLKDAGFDNPRLFVDGVENTLLYDDFQLEITTHYPRLRTYGNWVLALWELYVRNPAADRYAIFQDDFICYKNLRTYLDQCDYPEKGYWNLFSFMDNEPLVANANGWIEAKRLTGRGAVALVFNRDAVTTLLSSIHIANRPQDSKRGHRLVDGGVVQAFYNAGWTEYVHAPSLVQHTGKVSSMGNTRHPSAKTFKGKDFNALNLLPKKVEIPDKNTVSTETVPPNPEISSKISRAAARAGVDPNRIADWLGNQVDKEEHQRRSIQVSRWADRVLRGNLSKAKGYINQILSQ